MRRTNGGETAECQGYDRTEIKSHYNRKTVGFLRQFAQESPWSTAGALDALRKGPPACRSSYKGSQE